MSDHTTAAGRDFPWNRSVILSFEFVWGVGGAFALLWTMVPAYMALIGASKLVIGIVASMYTALTPIQFLSAHRYGGRPRKARIALGYMTAALPWLTYGVLLTVFPNLLTGAVRIGVFSLAIIVFTGTVCSTDVLYGSAIVDNTPMKRRGGLFGLRLLVVSVGMTLAAVVARRLMLRVAEPANYHIAFIIGPAVYCAASLIALLLREHVFTTDEATRRTRSVRFRLWPRIRLLLRKLTKNPNYRITIFFLVVLFIAKELNPFLVTYASDAFGVTGSGIVFLSLLRLYSGAALALLVGRVADRTGYRLVGVMVSLFLAAAFVIVAVGSISVSRSLALLYLAFGLHTGASSLAYMVLFNISVEIIGNEETPMLVAAGNLFMVPVVLITQPLCGLIIDATGSYFGVFVIGAVMALVSCAGFAALVREPRGRRLYVLRPVRRVP